MKFNPLKTRKGRFEQKIGQELAKPNPNINLIIEAAYEFEKDNIATIDKLKRTKINDTKKISGALKQCINSHGPITKQYIGSATKRIYGSLLTTEKKTISAVGYHDKLIVLAFYLYCIYELTTLLIK